jgi:hypothetical protein
MNVGKRQEILIYRPSLEAFRMGTSKSRGYVGGECIARNFRLFFQSYRGVEVPQESDKAICLFSRWLSVAPRVQQTACIQPNTHMQGSMHPFRWNIFYICLCLSDVCSSIAVLCSSLRRVCLWNCRVRHRAYACLNRNGSCSAAAFTGKVNWILDYNKDSLAVSTRFSRTHSVRRYFKQNGLVAQVAVWKHSTFLVDKVSYRKECFEILYALS